MRRSTLSIAFLSILCHAAFAAEPPPAGKPIVTRRYDVTELLAGGRPDDRPDPADHPLGPDDRIGLRTATVSEQREGIVRNFREWIEPDSWREAGGWFDIALDRNELVVTQTVENHAQIARMLGEFKGDERDRAWHKFEAAVVPKLALRDAPLADALAEISRAAGQSVEVDWPKVRTIGLTPQTRVTFAAEGLRAPVALHAILRAAGAGPDAALQFVYAAKGLVVTPDPRATTARPNGYVLTLQHLPARVAGLPAEPKPARAAVIAAVIKRLAGEFPAVSFRSTDAVVIVSATPAEHRRLVARLCDLETGVAK